MDEELWLDYYYGRNEKERDEEPDPDSREESKEIKYQEKGELENNIQNEKQDPNPRIEPSKDLEDKKSDQKIQHHQERRRWSRDHRSRITGRTYQRSQQTIIDKAPSLQREIKKEIPRPHEPLLQKYHTVMQLAFDAVRELKNPNEGKKSIYFSGRTYELKDKDKLATSTLAKYERETKAMLAKEKMLSKEEMIIDIIRTATQQSRSTYFRRKAILERIYAERTDDEDSRKMLSLLRHMPDYHRIRHIFGQEVEKSRETAKRRTCKIGLDAVIEYGNEIASRNRQMKYVPMIMYITGARISELQAMRIYAEPDNSLTVRIRSAKTGCAKNAPKERVLKIAPSDITKGLIRMGIGTKYREPYANIPTQTIRNNMLAARRRLSRRGIDVPSPHYFRHNFATRERAAGVDNEQLRREMGHTNQETTRQYGGGNFRHNH